MDFAPDDNDFSRRERVLMGAVAVLAVALVASLVFQAGVKLPGQQQQDQQQEEGDPFETYADANEETGTTSLSGAEVVSTINIRENGIAPASTEIGTGQAVRWVNHRSFPVRLEFDRTSQTPVLQPGGEVEMRFRGITYYKVFNHESDKRIGRGRINVQ